MDLIDVFNGNKENKIKLEITILRTKQERYEECVYGPDNNYDTEFLNRHQCKDCERNDKVCLKIKVDIDEFGWSYITSDKADMKSLVKLCEPVLKIEEIMEKV